MYACQNSIQWGQDHRAPCAYEVMGVPREIQGEWEDIRVWEYGKVKEVQGTNGSFGYTEVQ